MSEPTPEQIRWQLAAMSRRRFLGRSSLALGGLALGPTLLAACGGDDGGGVEAGSGTPRPSSRRPATRCASPTGPSTSTRRPSASSRTESGLSVTYTEDVNDNEEYFARIREPLSRNQDIGADMFIVTDFLVNRLIGLGWLAPLDDANIPNKGNLVAVAGGCRVRPGPDLQPPLGLGLHLHRLQPRADRSADHEHRRPVRSGVRGQGDVVQRPAGRPRARHAVRGQLAHRGQPARPSRPRWTRWPRPRTPARSGASPATTTATTSWRATWSSPRPTPATWPRCSGTTPPWSSWSPRRG